MKESEYKPLPCLTCKFPSTISNQSSILVTRVASADTESLKEDSPEAVAKYVDEIKALLTKAKEILAKAKKFYLIHNHPDENPEPSEDDIVTTKVIEKAAKNMNVKLVDHIIIYKGGFTCINR